MVKRPPPRASSVGVPADPTNRTKTRVLVAVCTSVAVYAGACAALWRAGARGGDAFVIVPQAIDDARAPQWLPSAEVARLNALGNAVRGRSILDPDLARDLAACYVESPWVSEVLHVRRAYPNRLQVKIAIRKPFAVVETTSGPAIVLDRTGVRLPASADPAGLPRLAGVPSVPPPPGHTWDDIRVSDGLRVLARHTSLVEREGSWARFAARGVRVGNWSRPDGRPVVEMVTAAGWPIVWGIDIPSGEGTVAEPSAAEKLSRLEALFPGLSEEKRPIEYVSVRHLAGAVIRFRRDAAAGRDDRAGGT